MSNNIMNIREDGRPYPHLMKEAGRKLPEQNQYGSLNGALDMDDVSKYN